MEHSYDALSVQTVKLAMGEPREVIETRRQIADVLGVTDRGHQRLPQQRQIG
jgi:hypothetical protein